MSSIMNCGLGSLPSIKLCLIRRLTGIGPSLSARTLYLLRGLASYLKPTIYALSTKYGTSAIGVVRITGSQTQHIYKSLTKRQTTPTPRLASVRKLFGEDGRFLDEALTLFFQGPNSYTGEDLLELHVHGGVAIIKAVTKAIGDLHDPGNDIHIRYADNGEFSQRAFLNGKFDLSEVEGIRDIINAETESQRISLLFSSKGEAKKLFFQWRQEMVKSIALLTTVIDFGEDHDVTEVDQLFDTVSKDIDNLRHEILQYLAKVKSSEVLLKGIKLALLGPPNAGKSSLLNFIANKDAAIVSEIAGTTRDVIDVPLNLNGFKVVVGDTAGIRSASDVGVVEKEGIRRAKSKSLLSDFALIVLSAIDKEGIISLRTHIKELEDARRPFLVVINKIDLAHNDNTTNDLTSILNVTREKIFEVSCLTGEGMPSLVGAITKEFQVISQTEGSDPITVSNRVQDLLEHDVLPSFDEFKEWREQDDVFLATESLKQAVDGIGKITGEAVGIEEILGVVFSSFCIGK